MATISLDHVKGLVRDVRDFPKPGIVFKDITPALAHAGALAFLCEQMAKPFKDQRIEKVLGIESRGFFFGTGIAERLGAGFVPVRKAGKLPWDTVGESYALEYGEARLEMHKDAVRRNERVLIVDDVLATGGTINATRKLVSKLDGNVVGATCFIEIGFLNGRLALDPLMIHTLWPL